MKYFTPKGDPLFYKCSCGECSVTSTVAHRDRMDEARGYAGFPFVITSGPRCAARNAQVGGAPGSDHLTGEASDVKVKGSGQRYAVVEAGLRAGFTRIGIGETFIHLGMGSQHIQRVMWLY